MHVSLSQFFLMVPATTELYTLSLHDALPIWSYRTRAGSRFLCEWYEPIDPDGPEAGLRRRSKGGFLTQKDAAADRKSTRLNSSHVAISYAVFCLKKKKRR